MSQAHPARSLLVATALSATACSLVFPLDEYTEEGQGGGGGSGGGATATGTAAGGGTATSTSTATGTGTGTGTGGGSTEGHLYVVGGYDDEGAPIAEVLVARIEEGGALGPWEVAGSLPLPTHHHASVATGDDLLVFGGLPEGSLGQVLVTTPTQGGTSTAFGALAPLPGSGRYHHGAVASSSHVFLLGGRTASAPLSEVLTASIEPGGLGSWTTATPLPTPRFRHASVAHGERLFVLGGSGAGADFYRDDVLTAAVEPTGLDEWTTVGALPSARYGLEAVAADGRLYVLGGVSVSGAFTDEVHFTNVAEDGSLGAWNLASPLSPARHAHACAVKANRVYCVGGQASAEGVSLPLADVQFAAITAQGTLGAWQSTSPLPGSRRYHSVEAL